MPKRGGSWNNESRNARCAYRNRNQPDNSNNTLGFRLVLSTLFHRMARNAARREVGGRGKPEERRGMFLAALSQESRANNNRPAPQVRPRRGATVYV
jgi:hypothetical protein